MRVTVPPIATRDIAILHIAVPLLSVFVFAAACGPKITTFQVSPTAVCPGESVGVDWEVKGTPHLDVRVDRAAPGSGGAGAGGGPPIDTLTFILSVEGSTTPEFRESAVLLLPATFERDVVFLTGPEGGGRVFARGEVSGNWSRMTIRELTTEGEADIAVRHGGIVDTVRADGSPSVALAGLPLTGPWELSVSDSPPGPDRLRVRASLECLSGGPSGG